MQVTFCLNHNFADKNWDKPILLQHFICQCKLSFSQHKLRKAFFALAFSCRCKKKKEKKEKKNVNCKGWRTVSLRMFILAGWNFPYVPGLSDCWKVLSVFPVFKNVWERSLVTSYYPVSLLTLLVFFLWLVSSLKNL